MIGKFETINDDAAVIQGVKDAIIVLIWNDPLSDLADIRSNQLAFPWANRLYSIHFISWNCSICGKNIKRILLMFGVLFTHFFYVVNSPRKDTSENISLSYFKLIDLERTLELYDIFRLDFEMFNYSVIDYLNLFSQKVWYFEVTTTNILFSTKFESPEVRSNGLFFTQRKISTHFPNSLPRRTPKSPPKPQP